MSLLVRVIAGFVLLVSYALAAKPPAYARDESSVDLRSFGLAFHAPQGWLREPETSYSQLARFAKVANGKLVGLLELRTAPAKGRTSNEIATAVGSDLGGQLADKREAPSQPTGTVELSLKPSEEFEAGRAAVFPVRDEFVIVVVRASRPADMASAFKTLMTSITVKAPTPAADDLAVDRKRPIPLFDSSILLPLPEPFRPDKVADEKQQMFLGVSDWVTGHDEASVQIQTVANPNHRPLKDVADATATQLATKLNGQINFTKVNDDPEAFISTPFSTAGKDMQRIVQMRMDDDQIAVLVFRSTAADPNVRDRYMEMAERVAKATRSSAASKSGGQAGGGS